LGTKTSGSKEQAFNQTIYCDSLSALRERGAVLLIMIVKGGSCLFDSGLSGDEKNRSNR